jgi:hypothetical protein
MRTTVTLDPDTEQLLRQWMRERKISFKQALNDAVRSALGDKQRPFKTTTVSMGTPSINLDRAIVIAGELEDEELIRRIRVGK